MTCAGYSNNVAAALKALDGVAEQKVEYPGHITTRKYNPAKTSVADIIKALKKSDTKLQPFQKKLL
jgi:copper chaperone CopZ